MNVYQKEVTELEKQFDTNIKTGLTDQEADVRLKRDGYNRLPEGKQDSWLSIFISQFQSPLIYILLIAAIIIFFVGDRKIDAFIISGILFFNAIIGSIQEGRTSNIVASLKRFIKTKSVVLRDGKHEIIDDEDLVVGDIIILKEGERVPADARVVKAERLQVDEAVLTGESKPVFKTAEPMKETAPISDQTGMVFKGTYIVGGAGVAIVIATGQNTEIGKLHKTIEEIDTDIPLRRELNRLSYIILLFILSMCVLLLVIGLAMGRPFNELMVILTALFICVVPEGLPVVLTLVLVTGAFRMAKQHVLIKNLQGVEALGRTDVIVIDKTGTLTRNELIVTRVYAQDTMYTVTGEGYFKKGNVFDNGSVASADQNSPLGQVAIASSLLNSSELSYNKKLNLFDIKGDPTEAALYVFAQKVGFNREQLKKQYHEQYEIPFDSTLKFHAGFYEHDNKGIVYLSGAPEEIFERCSTVSSEMKSHLRQLLDDGLRIVAIAKKTYSLTGMGNSGSESHQRTLFEKVITKDLELIGLCGIQDSIRPEVATMIDKARDAGLKIVMATGDHKDTALYVAKQVGLYKKGDEVIEGSQLEHMSDKELLQKIDNTTVFARVTPQDKVRIIKALHDKNYIVAMTGDGVNDVPSLLAADLGIAMGGIGTEVAKEASDLVLIDDSFVNIIRAIEQGRHIFYTLRRVVLYFFATNMGEILIVLFALFTNLPLPLTAAQILWLNFVTDGFLDVGLSMEPQEPDLLEAQWLKNRTHLVDKNLLIKMMYFAIPMGIASLLMFNWAYDGMPSSLPYARTMTLITMAMFQWFNAWNCRSEGKSLFQLGLFSNKWLIAATILVLLLQFAICYIPFMQYIFKTVPLSIGDWGMIFALSSPIIIIEELRKWIVRSTSQRAD